VETELEKVGKALPTKVTTPTMADYHPELDQSKELGPDQATYFPGLISFLHCCIELGRINIIVEVSLLSRFLACPREGHMQQAFHVFSSPLSINRVFGLLTGQSSIRTLRKPFLRTRRNREESRL
jgi:hypothetical protein